ncbi:MAG TPA: segregation/condensation protein A [Candidatus Acidoferrales bacterium]|nr:segregation/condensation protein A [Candidatus Acidoferrales bacterium]
MTEPPRPETRGGPAPPAVPYQVQLERYEGPLDLLLDLIRKQQIDIHDIPIAQITGQYLEYLRRMEQLDAELSGDFLFMAATLIYIKSKMLLPAEPALPGEPPAEDPREQLVHQLLEHEKYKSAAQMLHERQQIEDHIWSKPDLSLYEGGESESEIVVSLVDLVKVFQQVLERRQQRRDLEFERDEITVGMMIGQLREELARADTVRLVDFFERCPTRRATIAAFLAVLEMVRLGAVLMVQNETFGEILLRKHKMFDVVFSPERSESELGALDRDYR